MRVLVVEDDKKIARFVANGLGQAGYAVDQTTSGDEGLRLAVTESYDAAIIDLMLPMLDGLSLIGELRRKKINTPVIILSAMRTLDDRVKGLQAGGDDYLVKPFAFVELLARVQALIRRAQGSVEPTRLTVGSVSMDLLTRQVMREGKPIELQPREFSLLECLMRNVGRVITKTMILEHVWDYRFDPQTNVVDVLVCRLRAKLEKDDSEKIIRTIRGVGYALKEP